MLLLGEIASSQQHIVHTQYKTSAKTIPDLTPKLQNQYHICPLRGKDRRLLPDNVWRISI